MAGVNERMNVVTTTITSW